MRLRFVKYKSNNGSRNEFNIFFCYFLKKEIELFIKEAYQRRYEETLLESTVSTIFTLITIAFVIGGMIGGLSGGWLATKVGRKQGLLYNQVLSFTGAILSGSSKAADSYEMLIIGESVYYIITEKCNEIFRNFKIFQQVALESGLLADYLLVWCLCISPKLPLFIFVEV